MAKKKKHSASPQNGHLRKNEFFYDSSPDVRRRDGKGHFVYATARKGNKYKTNVITHSKRFFGEPTTKLSQNPRVGKKEASRISVPMWREEKFLKKQKAHKWRMSKKDRRMIKKINQKTEHYGRYRKK